MVEAQRYLSISILHEGKGTFRVESSEAVTNFMSLRDRLTWRTESLCARMSCRHHSTAVSAASQMLAF